MIGAAKRKSISPPGLSALWSILLLVVALCLPETRVWGFAITPQPASGVFESASPSSIGENYDAWQYDASGSPVAAKTPFNRNAVLEGFQDHHIISDKNPLTMNHDLLQQAGFNLQSRANKIFLPTDASLHPTRSIHLGRHTTGVSRNLADQMDQVLEVGTQNGWSQTQFDQALRAIISQERQLLRSGERALNRNARPGAQ